MNFRVRWHDIVKRPNDAASNGACNIVQVKHSRYHIFTGNYTGNNCLAVNTAEGVDLTLEEFHIKDEGWKKQL